MVRIVGRVVMWMLAVVAVVAATLVAGVYLVPEAAMDLSQKAMRRYAGLTRSEIDAGGLHFVYLEGGSGEPLVLLHGFGGDKDHFVGLAGRLSPSYRVILPDIPGFGESTRSPDLTYTIDEQVVRLHVFLQALGLSKLAIGGNSMGGWLAGAYAARYPHEVTSLWLLDPAGVASAPQSEMLQRITSAPVGGQSPMVPATVEDLESMLVLATAKPMYIPRPFLQVMVDRASANRTVQEKIVRESLASTPLEDRVQGLQTPTLIAWGDLDRACHVDGAAILHARMPRSKVSIMKGIGHVPMMEAPEWTVSDYRAFRSALP